jgi:hypothetical protein
MKALQIEALRNLEANRDGKFDCIHREGTSGLPKGGFGHRKKLTSVGAWLW